MNKEEALQKIIELAKNHQIDIREISQALRPTEAVPPLEDSSWVNKLYSYIGGILIFAGICALIVMKWQDFNLYERVTLTLGFGFSSFLLAFACLKYSSYQKASTPLLLIALFLEPTGLIILLQEYNLMLPIGWILIIAIIYFAHQRLAITSDKPLILAISTIVFAWILFAYTSGNSRIILNLGFGFIIFLLGLYHQGKQHKLTTPLFLVAALLEAGGLLTLFSLYTSILMPTWGVLLTSLILFIQFGIAFISTRMTVLAFITLIFLYSFFLADFELAGVPERLKWFILSSSLLAISSYINHSKYKSIAGLLFFISSLALLLVFFDMVRNKPYELLYLVVGCSLVFMAIIESSRILLINASIATLCFILYYSSQHFPHTVGWPITLIIIGLLLVGVSGIVIKLNKKYM
ncbi:hypothetical protein OQJ18_02000 [Fluoribacter dumoffii]|uniref:DUF2157 domain-containing protein n=1 Tax=Fluoribacter dumoffii TaxID=463 RepID=A0A377GAP2_9GAMM|nr:hypothetical protein [Fluoribacter dumoffii]KTC88620.1 hypothetical protein Ldum_2878 [Fluoribacter dumoffii NY 23]MCW8419140.1 hypothetical protein [Fluoribacter dumoffii]MCW8453016.1 hypothetical protein [Fluoribacter dumoffii]MCW8459766.1 hypothetical protein [Fluoribacter dumoffii]MCW8483123.1 hypothetical protein [Fluoribacter dumoffii]